MRINNNLMAMNTHRQLGVNNLAGSKSMEKLSSGFRINRAADDAAGLSISEKMRSQIRGLNQATRNAQDGISFIQTAEGALNEVSDMLVRLKELSVQVANGTYSDDDKINIGEEMVALGEAANEILTSTKFNGIDVFGTGATIAYGEDASLTVTIDAATITDFTALKGLTDAATDAAGAEAVTVTAVEDAITEMNTQRATYGAQQNKLEHVIKNQDTTQENLQAAESRIRDVDMASEMMEFTKNNILQQAATAMLAQANQAPQGVLQLLR
ncbi:flagellin N-terminal helical domain-containing protein [Natronincola ferrireducens]|uniref:Flagellin n=1 Tax=Natronincola ferrireducens TaxID=393762 RepID=A0A1G8XM29_9FIRM|nr:flagellin [Natronincola ferrireducens]SDJ91234.1 flagellin [Natronincola ferrireducens]